MDEKNHNAPQQMIIYGMVNIGCDQKGATFQTMVQDHEPKESADFDINFEEVEEKEQQAETIVEQEEVKLTSEEPNYYAPTINLTRFLKQEWFKENRARDEYDEQWIDGFVNALMESEWKDGIARDWVAKGKRNKVTQIKGYIVGLLIDNEVLKWNYNKIAAVVTGIKVKPRTFSKYMGDGGSQPYADWITDYISNN